MNSLTLRSQHTHLIVLIVLCPLISVAAQVPKAPVLASAEDVAFTAVSRSTSAASSVAAAEDFIANFPNSTKRINAARLVADQLTTIRNPQIAIVLLERALAIFTGPEEREAVQAVAIEVYANGDRPEKAFGLAEDLLSRKPDALAVLVQMSYLGAREARYKNLQYVDLSLKYASQAIEILERDERPSEVSDSIWMQYKAKLSGLYQQVGIIKLAQGKTDEAKAQVLKATQVGPGDPTQFALLGRLLDEQYEEMATAYQSMSEGSAKQDEKKKLDSMLEEVIDAYARAAGLAAGKDEYQKLLLQVIPDLTRYYKYRHNQSTVGLQQLINKYRYRRP